MSARRVRFYGIRVTQGQEVMMALLMEERVKLAHLPVLSLCILPGLRGVIVAEAEGSHVVQRMSAGLKHVRGLMRGSMEFQELERLIAPRPMIEVIQVGDLVEITGGPFLGMRGRVLEVDKSRGEVKVEVTEAAYPLPITISADYVRPLREERSSR
ncbi:MAG: transcription elongation factor Spt5 [Thermofilaceae archaeon]